MALRSRLPEIAAALQVAVDEAVKAGAELVVEAAKSRVPVESGRLRDAIHTDTEADGTYVVAGNHEVFYGHMVELGTSHSPPHPFLVPALEENRGEIEGLIRTQIRKVVR